MARLGDSTMRNHNIGDIVKIESLKKGSCRENALLQHFQQHVTVTEVRLMSDRQGQPKGFGFAEFSSIPEASKALHLLQVSCFLHPYSCKLSKQFQPSVFLVNMTALAIVLLTAELYERIRVDDCSLNSS